MKKCVVLMSVAFCISLGAVRAQTNLVGEHIEGGWYYSLYDDYGEKTAILTHVLDTQFIQGCINTIRKQNNQ